MFVSPPRLPVTLSLTHIRSFIACRCLLVLLAVLLSVPTTQRSAPRRTERTHFSSAKRQCYEGRNGQSQQHQQPRSSSSGRKYTKREMELEELWEEAEQRAEREQRRADRAESSRLTIDPSYVRDSIDQALAQRRMEEEFVATANECAAWERQARTLRQRLADERVQSAAEKEQWREDREVLDSNETALKEQRQWLVDTLWDERDSAQRLAQELNDTVAATEEEGRKREELTKHELQAARVRLQQADEALSRERLERAAEEKAARLAQAELQAELRARVQELEGEKAAEGSTHERQIAELQQRMVEAVRARQEEIDTRVLHIQQLESAAAEQLAAVAAKHETQHREQTLSQQQQMEDERRNSEAALTAANARTERYRATMSAWIERQHGGADAMRAELNAL